MKNLNELKLKALQLETKMQLEINNIINFIPIMILWVLWISFLNLSILDNSYYIQFKWISFFPLMFLTIASDLFRFRNNVKLIFTIESLKLEKKGSTVHIYWSEVEAINILKQSWKNNLYNRNIIIEVIQMDKKVTTIILENSLLNLGFFKYNMLLKFFDENLFLKSKVKNNGNLTNLT